MRSLPRSFRSRLASAFVVAIVVMAVLAAPAFAEWSASAVRPQTVTAGVLAAPTGTVATDGGCVPRTAWPVRIDWSASSSAIADGYEILRSGTAGGPYTSVGTVAGQATVTFTDTTSAANTTYYYVVQATRNQWRSPNSNEATFTTLKRNCN